MMKVGDVVVYVPDPGLFGPMEVRREKRVRRSHYSGWKTESVGWECAPFEVIGFDNGTEERVYGARELFSADELELRSAWARQPV